MKPRTAEEDRAYKDAIEFYCCDCKGFGRCDYDPDICDGLSDEMKRYMEEDAKEAAK
jgi:hypothetical protein